jgi:hypothetical protein
VHVSGGYFMDPTWLAANRSGYDGQVVAFMSGGDRLPAVVLALDRDLVLPDEAGQASGPVQGSFLVLQLGHLGADWAVTGSPVRVWLYERRPDMTPSSEGGDGVFVESHASYRIIRDRPMPPPLPRIGEPSPWP